MQHPCNDREALRSLHLLQLLLVPHQYTHNSFIKSCRVYLVEEMRPLYYDIQHVVMCNDSISYRELVYCNLLLIALQ